MFDIDLLKMTDQEIEDMCDVIKFLARASIWKILKLFVQDPYNYKKRNELLDAAKLSNITKDKNFLIENNIITEHGSYYKYYSINNPERYYQITQDIKNMIFEFKNKRYYRN